MELILQSAPGRPIWDHFLMRDTSVSATFGVGGALSEVPMPFSAGAFRVPIPNDPVTIGLTVKTTFRQNGRSYQLLTIRQRFQPQKDGGQVTGLTAGYWQKVIPGQAMRRRVNPRSSVRNSLLV